MPKGVCKRGKRQTWFCQNCYRSYLRVKAKPCANCNKPTIRLREYVEFCAATEKRLIEEKRKIVRRVTVLSDALAVLASRGVLDPVEASQLGVGRLIPATEDDPARLVMYNLADLEDMTDMATKDQATVAKFRLIKRSFQEYQSAVSSVFDQISSLSQKNELTSADFDRLRDLRMVATELIGRHV